MNKKGIVYFLLAVAALSFIVLVTLSTFNSKQHSKVRTGGDQVAVIHVEGVIMGGRNSSNLLGDQGGTESTMKNLRDAAANPNVKAIVLRINSPGGSAPAAQELGEEIKKVRAQGKIVVTSMGDMAASGGYWLAAVTDKIYANPATLTGSIGVYIPYSNWQELYQKIGIKQEKIKSGPHKDMLSPEKPLSPDERAIAQSMVDDLYEQFVTVVAEGRKLDKDQVRKLADGRIYTGNQAKAAGLIDEFGGLYDSIEGAARLAGISHYEVKDFDKLPPWSALFGGNVRISVNNWLEQFGLIENALPLAPQAMPEGGR